MFIFKIFLAAAILLIVGDFLSTFFYHVPEHVFGKFHSIVHHGKNRSFIHYAVLTKNPLVLLDGFLGVLPYFIFVPWLWKISAIGTILGLIIGELHVMWRHASLINWTTPKAIKFLCAYCLIITPEQHWLHHQNSNLAYGDIFTFYDRPAQIWLKFLSQIKKQYQHRAKA
ncbi:MAG TPA: sterol desaturase family protein [Xenococcaceae cyanobacterium]